MILLLGGAASAAGGDGVAVAGHQELEELLSEKAGLTMSLPDVGYSWGDDAATGDATRGSLWVDHDKMTYYFVHWGPEEVESITPEYARERIPKIWPSEGLEIQRTESMTVAGHPAIFAEALPKRPFYHAHFLIWNCPQTGRQFIADMNYNVRHKTPYADLQAQIDATTETLSCHPGSPIAALPSHPQRYVSSRFGVSFSHPLSWYVFENPYGVPHPAYRGRRDSSIGSLLAWPQDSTVRLGFLWQPIPEEKSGQEGQMLAGSTALYTAAVAVMRGEERFESFDPEAVETVHIGGNSALKVLGRVVATEPEEKPPGYQAEGRAMIVAVDHGPTGKRLFFIVWIDDYRHEGVLRQPHRDIFDRWAWDLLEGL